MEAALLMLDVVGIALVLAWAARNRGADGLFAWRAPTGAKAPQRRD